MESLYLDKKPEKLYIEDGMRLEALRADERVAFLGRVKDFKERTLKLVDESGGTVPPVVYGTEVKLRGAWPGQGLVTYHGTVFGSSSEMWMIGDLSEWYGWERRGFYRQMISVEAKVLRTYRARPVLASEMDYKVDCRILDISGSGALITCSKEVYAEGDGLSVTEAQLLPGEKPISFKCTVVRVVKGDFHNLYGCKFHGMTIPEQDYIARVVFRLQQEDRKKQSDMESR